MEDFHGPNLKFARAQTHLQEFRELVALFLAAQKYKAVAKLDLEPGNLVWVVAGDGLYSHEALSPTVSDALHNLRDSLDLAISVLVRNDGQLDDHVEFPTADDRDTFEKKLSRRKEFSTKLVAVLHSLEPYVGGRGTWLRTLHKLAAADKHRLIVSTVFGADVVHVKADGVDVPMRFFNGPAALEVGKKLARAKASEWPEIKHDQEEAITATIAFDGRSGLLRGWEIHDGLIRLMNETQMALDRLATCL